MSILSPQANRLGGERSAQGVLRKSASALSSLALLLGVASVPGPAGANGWEHAAIPFDALVEALGFERPEVRSSAARSLGFRGQPSAVAPLLAALAAPEENPHVRGALYSALGRLGDNRALPALFSCLTEETRPELRADCATALGRLGDGAALGRLLDALKGESKILVRMALVDALGHFGEPEAVAALEPPGQRRPQHRLELPVLHPATAGLVAHRGDGAVAVGVRGDGDLHAL